MSLTEEVLQACRQVNPGAGPKHAFTVLRTVFAYHSPGEIKSRSPEDRQEIFQGFYQLCRDMGDFDAPAGYTITQENHGTGIRLDI